MMENHKNADKILESLDHSRRAVPSDEFLQKMENLAIRYTAVVDKVSLSTIVGIAASFTLLIMINMMVLNKSNDTSAEQSFTTNTTSSYDLIPTKSLYNE